LNHIGNIVKHYRTKNRITQKELAGNYCSTKYVFLIEKNERTPSSELLRHFSDKLGVDLFNICQYLDCQDPVDVYETIILFEKYRRKSDFINLYKLTESKRNAHDFLHSPWKCEIEINQFIYQIFIEGKINESISGLNILIKNMESGKFPVYHFAYLHALLSACYLMSGSIYNSLNSIETSIQMIEGKSGMSQYKQIVITTKLILLFVYLKSEKYDEILKEAPKLLEYQLENNLHERTHYTFYLIAMASFKLEVYDQAEKHCLNAIFISLLEKKPFDVKNFFKHKCFIQLLDHMALDNTVVKHFYRDYHIDPYDPLYSADPE
jgi:transcriptional regulator with XRE-family HTH domain